MKYKIIGLSGFSKCGKDTAFEEINKKIPGRFQHVAFADVVKEEVKQMLEVVDLTPDFTNAKTKEFWQDFLVFWEIKRRKISTNYWIRKAFEKITSDTIITDVKYLNEVEYILNKGGIVIRIKRNNVNAVNVEEYGSIMAIDTIYNNLPVVNNNGTPEELANEILKIIEE